MTGDVRENRLRRMAKRQGLVLEKSRRRDPRAIDYGVYRLVKVTAFSGSRQLVTSEQGITLDEVEAYLTQ
jgi:hypothetical protein